MTKKIYFLTLIIFIFFSPISNAQNYDIICGNWYEEINKKSTKQDQGQKVLFYINLDKNIIQIDKWVYSNGDWDDLTNTLNIFNITDEEIYARGKSLDQSYTWDLHYNFKEKSYTSINYEEHNTNKIYSKWHGLSCNDLDNIKLALSKKIENKPKLKDQNNIASPSSVSAKNTLVGVSFLCAFEEHNKYNIIGFGFLENNRIRGVQGDIDAGITLNSVDIPKRIIEYETSPISIKIFVKNESEFMKINRKSLELSFHKNSKNLGSISGDKCEIYKDSNIETNFEKLKEKLITELTKDNKL